MSTTVEIGGNSTIGKREKQEDCFMAYHMVEKLPEKTTRFSTVTERHVNMGIVCDGMGGEEHGAPCARQAVQAYGETFAETGSFNTMWKERMFMSLYAANAAVYDYKDALNIKKSKSGCTLVSAVICDDKLHYVSVGDSYILLFRREPKTARFKEYRLNHLHKAAYKYYTDKAGNAVTNEKGNIVEELISDEQERELREKGLPPGTHIRHKVSSAIIGMTINALDYQTGVKLADGDVIILATDGIVLGLGEIERENIINNYANVSAQQLADEIIRVINKTGKPRQDNACCVALKVSINQ